MTDDEISNYHGRVKSATTHLQLRGHRDGQLGTRGRSARQSITSRLDRRERLELISVREEGVEEGDDEEGAVLIIAPLDTVAVLPVIGARRGIGLKKSVERKEWW